MPEARTVWLSRAREDCPASVVPDNEGSFVEHYNTIVITQLAQTNKIVSKSFNDVSRPGGIGESRWERKESTSSGGFAFSRGHLDDGVRCSGAGSNREGWCEVVVTGTHVSNSCSCGVGM